MYIIIYDVDILYFLEFSPPLNCSHTILSLEPNNISPPSNYSYTEHVRNNWMGMAQCAMGSIIQVAPQYAATLVEITRIYDRMMLDIKYGLICNDRA